MSEIELFWDKITFYSIVNLEELSLKKRLPTLSLSIPSYKELEGHPFPPHKKKAEQTENQQFFLNPPEDQDHRTHMLRGRQVGTENHDLLEQKPLWAPAPEQENLGCNWRVAGNSVQASLRINHPRRAGLAGPLTFVKYSFQEPYQVLTKKTGKIPSCFHQG